MDTDILRIGILGSASIAERFIVPSLVEFREKFEVIGVASREKVSSNKFANKFGIKEFVGYESILKKELIDAIYIPLPNGLHYSWVKKALEKGIHVLVEKSLACSLKEVTELTEIARKKKIALVENFQFRFHSQLKVIKKLLAEGTIGDLRSIRSSFGFPPFPDETNIRYKKELGGGSLLDAGAYTLKIAQEFMGLNCSVTAGSLYFDETKQVDIWGGGFVQSNNSSLFTEVAFGFDHFYQCLIEFWGTKGKLSAKRIFTAPPGFRPTIVIESANGIEEINLETDNHFKNMLSHFYEQCRFGGSEFEHEINLNQARLVEEFKKVAKLGCQYE